MKLSKKVRVSTFLIETEVHFKFIINCTGKVDAMAKMIYQNADKKIESMMRTSHMAVVKILAPAILASIFQYLSNHSEDSFQLIYPTS